MRKSARFWCSRSHLSYNLTVSCNNFPYIGNLYIVLSQTTVAIVHNIRELIGQLNAHVWIQCIAGRYFTCALHSYIPCVALSIPEILAFVAPAIFGKLSTHPHISLVVWQKGFISGSTVCNASCKNNPHFMWIMAKVRKHIAPSRYSTFTVSV